MEKVINKRSELMNFFKNENKTYTKLLFQEMYD